MKYLKEKAVERKNSINFNDLKRGTKILYIQSGSTTKTSIGVIVNKLSTRSEDFVVVFDKGGKMINIPFQNVSDILEN